MLSLRSALKNDPNFVWCLGPGCKSGQIHEGGTDAPLVICKSCGFLTCFQHLKPWHNDLVCNHSSFQSGGRAETAGMDARESERRDEEARQRVRPPISWP
jgi:hypothetical protein